METGDWLYVEEGNDPLNAFFEYELEFEDGLRSIVVNDRLIDFTDKFLTILGRRYTIMKATKRGTSLSLDMLNNAARDIINERETRSFIVNGRRYDVQLVAVQSTNTASFRVNTELTPQLSDGSVYSLGVNPTGPLYIGVTDIAYSPSGNGAAKVFLAPGRLELEDANYQDGEQDPDLGFHNVVRVDGETIEDGWIQMKGVDQGQIFRLDRIKYRLLADALPGSRDLYIPPGHTIREYLDEPQGMLGENWNVRYNGLNDTRVSLIKIDPAGNDEYNLEFENIQGLVYKFPYISNENGVFKFGDDNDDLVMIEGNHTQRGSAGNINSARGVTEGNVTFNIGLLDYFILTDSGESLDDTATSHVVRYNSLDTSERQLQFDDEAYGSRRFIYETTNLVGTIGKAELVFGGNTYITLIANASTSGPTGGTDNPLMIDQNKDGRIERDRVRLTLNGGGILDPMAAIGTLNVRSNAATANLTHLSDGGEITGLSGALGTGGTWSNTGIRISNATGGYGTNVTMTLYTLSEDFDENLPSSFQGQSLNPMNEITNVTITKRSNNQVGIDLNSAWSNSGFRWWQPDEDPNNFYEMNDYGVYFNLFRPPANPKGTQDAETLTIEYPLQQRGANVEVIGANQPPVLDFIGDRHISIGQTLTIQMNATDPEEDPLAYSTNAASVIRSQFFFDNQTGLFRWQPQRSDIGNYLVTFTVSDGLEITSETIRISVPSQPTMSVIGAPVIGNTISLFLSDPPSANQFYILAMSLGNVTGFPLGDGRTFPLDFDEVFVASLYYPQSLGLRESVGVLNPLGNAVAQWAIPNIQELNGTTVYLAFLTIDPNRPLPESILAIANASPITLRQ